MIGHPNLKLWMEMTSSAGGATPDLTDGANAGTLTNATLQGGGGFLLNTASSKILCANAANFAFEYTDAWTYEVAFKINSLSPPTSGVRFFIGNQNAAPNYNGIALWYNYGIGKITLTRAYNTTNYDEATVPHSFGVSNLYTIHAVCYGGTGSDKLKIYINGVQQIITYNNILTPATTQTGNKLEIGNRLGTFNFDGIIYKAKVYNYALPISDIKRAVNRLHPLTRS